MHAQLQPAPVPLPLSPSLDLRSSWRAGMLPTLQDVLCQLDRVGVSKAGKLLAGIEAAKTLPLHKLLAGLGIP